MSKDFRAPKAIVLEAETTGEKPSKKARHNNLIFDEELENTSLVTVPQTENPTRKNRRGWLGILLTALLGLILMWSGLALTQLVESFFTRNMWLGWLALGLAAVAGFAALAIILREIMGLLRLNRIEHLQEQAARALNLDERSSALALCESLTHIYAKRPDMTWRLKQFASHKNDILDPRDRVRLAERLLVEPLDEAAHKIIARRARRVTLLTTVTPAAALDILFVAAQNFAMLRDIATLYGGKPSTLATLRLARMVATHLAVTGGLALSDNLIQHVVGKGLLGRLSARFGEGAVNGILTSRIGLAATDVCRPIPRTGKARDTLTSLLKEVLTFGEKPQPEESSA